MNFREIFQQFYDYRHQLKVIFVASTDPVGQPNCAPKLLIEIVRPNKVYFVDLKGSLTLRSVRENPQSSIAFMDENRFLGFRFSGRVEPLALSVESERVRRKWFSRLVTYEAQWMLERIKGLGISPSPELVLPDDVVIMRFTAQEASQVQPGRIIRAIAGKGPGSDRKMPHPPIARIIELQGRIVELEKMESRHESHENELKQSRDFLQQTLDGVSDPVYVIGPDHTILSANAAASAVEGDGDISGRFCYAVTHGRSTPCEGEGMTCPLKQCIATRGPAKVTHMHKSVTGEPVEVEISATPVFDNDGKFSHIIETCHDVTEHIELERKLEQSSLEDELTGLYNRRGFMALADKQLKIARRSGKEIFLLFSDLDHLKPINDTFGHDMGDKALKDAAAILRRTFRDSDIIARVGGDEFAVALVDCPPERVCDVRERLEHNLEEYNQVPDKAFPLNLSVGLASCLPEERVGLEELIRRADEAMYEQKLGRN